jgi:hypothetical protein
MIITATTPISDANLERFGWAGLRRFHNVEVVQTLISDLHKVSRNDPNIKKQAMQIRYCLQQAREYFDAAKAVSLVTKPVLLYYSIMNLALAEILLKQDGNSSLDRARQQHNHHGLTFEFSNQKKQSLTLANQAAALRARPLIHSVAGASERFGTFELWHRSARSLPLVGTGNEITLNNASLTRFVIIFTQDDERLPLLPSTGITLLDCFSSLPRMSNFVYSCGITPDMVRGKITSMYRQQDNWYSLEIIIHPSSQEKAVEFFSNLTFSANYTEHIDFQDFDNGGIISINGLHGHCSIPPGIALNKNNVYFSPRKISLNEFGMLYVALYICGNYARYYPDFWIKDVDTYSPLALAVEELVHVAEETMALLMLSELSRTYFVPES